MAEQPKEELKIKDLLIKLQVLSNGLIEERKKSQNYLNRLKEYEESLQKKDAEIVELTKEKFDLKSKLTLEKSKQNPAKTNDSYFSSILSKITQKPVDESKVTKLEEKINQQNYEIKDLSKRLMAEREDFDEQKIKFQTMLTIQTQEIAKLKENLEKAKNQAPPMRASLPPSSQQDKIESLKKQFNMERDEFDKKLSIVNTELKEVKEKNEEMTKDLNLKNEELHVKNIENMSMKSQITKIYNELNQLKLEIHNKQLSPRVFQVERIKDGIVKNKTVMTIMFQWNKNEKRCEVIFKRMKNGKLNVETVNIIDIAQFKYSDKKHEYIDIEFHVSFIYINSLFYIFLQNDGTPIKYSVIAHELIQDYLFQAYNDFLKKAKELMK